MGKKRECWWRTISSDGIISQEKNLHTHEKSDTLKKKLPSENTNLRPHLIGVETPTSASKKAVVIRRGYFF